MEPEVADVEPEEPRGRVTLDPPVKKSKHVRSQAQEEVFAKAREKAHSMMRGCKLVVDPPPVSLANGTEALDKRMTELVAMTRLQLENERLQRKVEKYRGRSLSQAPDHAPSQYNNLILSEIKRLTGK